MEAATEVAAASRMVSNYKPRKRRRRPRRRNKKTSNIQTPTAMSSSDVAVGRSPPIEEETWPAVPEGSSFALNSERVPCVSSTNRATGSLKVEASPTFSFHSAQPLSSNSPGRKSLERSFSPVPAMEKPFNRVTSSNSFKSTASEGAFQAHKNECVRDCPESKLDSAKKCHKGPSVADNRLASECNPSEIEKHDRRPRDAGWNSALQVSSLTREISAGANVSPASVRSESPEKEQSTEGVSFNTTEDNSFVSLNGCCPVSTVDCASGEKKGSFEPHNSTEEIPAKDHRITTEVMCPLRPRVRNSPQTMSQFNVTYRGEEADDLRGSKSWTDLRDNFPTRNLVHLEQRRSLENTTSNSHDEIEDVYCALEDDDAKSATSIIITAAQNCYCQLASICMPQDSSHLANLSGNRLRNAKSAPPSALMQDASENILSFTNLSAVDRVTRETDGAPSTMFREKLRRLLRGGKYHRSLGTLIVFTLLVSSALVIMDIIEIGVHTGRLSPQNHLALCSEAILNPATVILGGILCVFLALEIAFRILAEDTSYVSAEIGVDVVVLSLCLGGLLFVEFTKFFSAWSGFLSDFALLMLQVTRLALRLYLLFRFSRSCTTYAPLLLNVPDLESCEIGNISLPNELLFGSCDRAGQTCYIAATEDDDNTSVPEVRRSPLSFPIGCYRSRRTTQRSFSEVEDLNSGPSWGARSSVIEDFGPPSTTAGKSSNVVALTPRDEASTGFFLDETRKEMSISKSDEDAEAPVVVTEDTADEDGELHAPSPFRAVARNVIAL